MTDTMTQGPARAKKGGQEAAVRPRAFVAASRKNDRDSGYDETKSLTTAEQSLKTYQVIPTAYLRAVWVHVAGTAVNTTSTTVAYNENGPFNVLARIRFLDSGSREIHGTLGGYDLYLINKYGGYMNQGDVKAFAGYSATTGTATTAGSFEFGLMIPLEIIKRTALGSQLNKSGGAQMQLEWALSALATIYSTAPATSVSVRVRAMLTSWLDPEDKDALGNAVLTQPPLLHTTQYWSKQTYDDVTTRRALEGIDGLVRMFIFVAYRSGSTRANGEADWPDPFSLRYEEAYLIQSRIRFIYRQWIAQEYRYNAANEAAEGRDNGVYPVWEFMQDWGLAPGGELSREYLPVSSATNLTIEGTFSNADDLDLLVNTVVPYPQTQESLRALSQL